MHEKHGIAGDMLHGFNWTKWTTGTPTERLQLIPAGQEHILEQEDGKKRWVGQMTNDEFGMSNCLHFVIRTSAFALPPALQAALNKKSGANRKSPEQIDGAICQLVSKAITTEGEIIDIFTAAGIFSANGARQTSPGHRPGYATSFHQALSGLVPLWAIKPRALP